MSSIVDFERLFDAAHRVNYVHFPNRLVIERRHAKWFAGIAKADEMPFEYVSGADSAEALSNLIAKVRGLAADRKNLATREAEGYTEAMCVLDSLAKAMCVMDSLAKGSLPPV